MKNSKNIKNRLRYAIAAISAVLILLSVTSCGSKAEYPGAKQPFFDATDLTQIDFGTFTLKVPSEWEIKTQKSIDEVSEGEVFFEITGQTVIDNNVSRFQIVKEYTNENEGVEDFLTIEDADKIISSLTQTYNTEVTLQDCGIYNFNGVCAMTLCASLTYNEIPYRLYQTYFLVSGRIIIMSGCVARGADENDIASIPYSVGFPQVTKE
ncbi:MAG: hypothetical protein GX061_01885 [Eubacteriaceae bacterium]|nr:hypothetical protein [Eubacteriaceae bacterium]